MPDLHLRALPGHREGHTRRRWPGPPERRQRALPELHGTYVQALPISAGEGRALHALGKTDGGHREAGHRAEELRIMKSTIVAALLIFALLVPAQTTVPVGDDLSQALVNHGMDTGTDR